MHRKREGGQSCNKICFPHAAHREEAQRKFDTFMKDGSFMQE